MRGVRAAGPGIQRDVMDRDIDVPEGGACPRRASTGLDALDRRCGRYRAPGGVLVHAERAAIFTAEVWAARGHEDGVALLRQTGIPGYSTGPAGLLPRAIRPSIAQQQAFARPRCGDCGTKLDFRMGYGSASRADPGADRHGLQHGGKNRDLRWDW